VPREIGKVARRQIAMTIMVNIPKI